MRYLITDLEETKDSVRVNLFGDEKLIFKQVMYMRCFRYLLEKMSAQDTLRQRFHRNEEDDEPEYTGAQLRSRHESRLQEIAQFPMLPCTRCDGATTYIGYYDIEPYPYGTRREAQHTVFMQCQECGQYRQIGFANGDDWIGGNYRELMQQRNPFVRIAKDPYVRGTLKVTSRTNNNPIGRVNLDGWEFHNGGGIVIYDQDEERWRRGRLESDENGWYFTARDGAPDFRVRQGMLAKLR